MIEEMSLYARVQVLHIGQSIKLVTLLDVALVFGSVCALGRLQVGVPIVLNRVVRSAEDMIGNLGPSISVVSLQDMQDPYFFLTPGALSNQWIEMIVPPLSALFATSASDLLRDKIPLARAYICDILNEDAICVCIPHSLCRA